MEQKILILGAKGMLGRQLAQEFLPFKPTLWDKEEIDITDKEKLEEKLLQLRPTLIINVAAYTDVDGCEENFDLAVLVNGLAVGYLAKAAKQLNAVLVHFSTDYVFSGDNKDGYQEQDNPQPINAYGQSKLRGEQELQKYADKFYLIRTSWLYGPGGKNFVDTILTKAAQTEMIQVVNDQFGKPTYTLDLAKRTRELIEEKQSFGIYHITNETPRGGITWFEFAQKAVDFKRLSTKVEPCTTDKFPRPAKRPKYSALINTKLSIVRDWQVGLSDYLLNN